MMSPAAPTASAARTPSVEAAIEAMPPRLRDIAVMRGLGYTLTEIARHMHLTPQAVSIMLMRFRGRIKELGVRTEHWQLSTRAANALGRLGIATREQARKRDAIRLMRGQRNCGEKTIAEVERWLADADGG